jgi:pyridoxal phosphate enzyme (YggS family)
MAAAARAVGRAPESVRLIAVTKGVDREACAELARLGQLDLGENRVQELAEKHAYCAALGLPVRWHLTGHLQRNKARRAVELAEEIHSVDSLRLAEALDRIASETGRAVRAYLEVGLVRAPTRSGFGRDELCEESARLRELASIQWLGLMTMAAEPGPHAPNPEGVFRELARLRDTLPAELFEGGRGRLSMGMSSDFEAAIAAGSDVVRIGSALFDAAGARAG